jgi:hypothetical protein
MREFDAIIMAQGEAGPSLAGWLTGAGMKSRSSTRRQLA